jgi:hypothetical protein
MRHRSAGLALGILTLGLSALAALPVSAQEQPPVPAPESAADIPPPSFTAISALKSAGAVSVHAPGPIARGDVILALPVTHGLTGALRQEVKKMGLFSKDSIPAGSPVFGIPMSGDHGPEIIWCAPRSKTQGDKTLWNTTCFPKGGFTPNLWVPVYVPLFPTYLSYPVNSTHGATEVLVEQKAVDFPALKLTFTFTEWDKTDADVFVSVDAPGVKNPVRNRSLPRLPDGSVRLKALGGEFKLTPVGTDRHAATLEVITPPSIDAGPEF